MIELIITDSDGPEGMFERKQFVRSYAAIDYIIDNYKNRSDYHDHNFQIINHYKND